MRQLILIHRTEATARLFAAMTDDERRAAYRVYWDVESELEHTGELVDSKAVDEDGQRTVFRNPEGGPVSRPVAEGADVVSGYYLVDVADAARADEIAARFPEAAVEGGIRVGRVLTQEDFDALGL
jgi:hypothetical protein